MGQLLHPGENGARRRRGCLLDRLGLGWLDSWAASEAANAGASFPKPTQPEAAPFQSLGNAGLEGLSEGRAPPIWLRPVWPSLSGPLLPLPSSGSFSGKAGTMIVHAFRGLLSACLVVPVINLSLRESECQLD